jgi:hypothetical protein
MTDNAVYLHGKPRKIAQVTRVGFREHGLCEQLLSSNKLASRRFVLDASTEGTVVPRPSSAADHGKLNCFKKDHHEHGRSSTRNCRLSASRRT